MAAIVTFMVGHGAAARIAVAEMKGPGRSAFWMEARSARDMG